MKPWMEPSFLYYIQYTLDSGEQHGFKEDYKIKDSFYMLYNIFVHAQYIVHDVHTRTVQVAKRTSTRPWPGSTL